MAVQLDRMGHSVSVIDRSADAFRRLPSDFNGRKVKGVGYDRDALEQAGIDEAYAFVAVSNGDNSNIVAARVARESFGVDNVVARIYDSRRADVYERLGIPTVATVRQTADQMMRRILPAPASWRTPRARSLSSSPTPPRSGSVRRSGYWRTASGCGWPGSHAMPRRCCPRPPPSSRSTTDCTWR